MSYTTLAAYSRNNESDLFGQQGLEDLGNDFFEQFVTFDQEVSDCSASSDTTLLERSVCGAYPAAPPSRVQEGPSTYSIMPNRPGESWEFTENAASPHHTLDQGSHLYSELTGRAAISDHELLSVEGVSLQSPQNLAPCHPSLPPSPTSVSGSLVGRRNRVVKSFSNTFQRASVSSDRALRSPIRKSSRSLKMMMASRYEQPNDIDTWGHKLTMDPSKFCFEYPEQSRPLSPPPSAQLSDVSDHSNPMMQKSYEGMVGNDDPALHWSTRPSDFTTPLQTPVLDSEHSRRTSFQHPSSDVLNFPPTPQFHHSSNSWSQASSMSDLNAYESSPAYGEGPPVWWSHSTAQMAQPSPSSFHADPHRATKSLAYQLQSELQRNSDELACSPTNMAQNGLMIQMPEPSVQQSFVVSSPSVQQSGYFGAAQPQPQAFHSSSRQFAQAAPRQPQLSSPPFHLSSPPMRKGSSSTGSEPPSPKSMESPIFQGRKRRAARAKTPRTPSQGGMVDFVNFTPYDSRKILNGVAPSGSSKTKARREKEALDKRRRLSQAALRAVQAAGGDVGSLVEQGLFM